MDPSDCEEEIFARVLEQPAQERTAFLTRECGGDTARIRRIEALLRAHEDGGDFLSGVPVADGHLFAGTGNLAALAAEEMPGARIGRYRILEKIGEGGGGSVYLAEQSEPVSRQVALKIIKLGMDTQEIIARFAGERQALAMMEHSHIARVFDAGATATGRPFFVMELVRGARITAHCDRLALTIPQRLALFGDVCRAIEHAHQKGIIHRDIKPSNILVTMEAGVAAVKVIDFGIAKAIRGRLTDQTVRTTLDQFIGTPAYMSPEQIRTDEWDIDTRSDLYSLGVLLYQLLTSRTPFDRGGEATLDRDEQLRRIRDVEPARPSACVAALAEADALQAAINRGTTVPKLVAELRGELDWIVLRCLEKDRTRRYATAGALASDLQRYLADEPVEARPPEKLYLARKFARRHRAALLGAGAFAALLIAATAVSAGLAIRARRAERRAAAEAAVSLAVRNFLEKDLLSQASPDLEPNRDLPLRTVLDRAAQKIKGRFPDRPLVEASLRETIAATYESLGEAVPEAAQLEQARALYERYLGPDDPQTLGAADALATAYATAGEPDRAEPLLRQTVARMQAVLGSDAAQTIHGECDMLYLFCLQSRYADGEAIGESALARARKVLGPDDVTTRQAMNNLASIYWGERKLPQAEKLGLETVEAQTRAIGPEAPDTLSAISNLASVYWAEENNVRSEEMNLKVLAVRRRLLGPDHRETLRSMNNLTTTYRDEGKLVEAEAMAKATLETRQRVLGPESNDALSSQVNLALVYVAQRRWSDAEAILVPTIALYQKKLGPAHPNTLAATIALAVVLEKQHRWDEEAGLLRDARTVRKSLSPLTNAGMQSLLDNLGGLLVLQRRFSEAEEVLRLALAGHRAFAPEQWRTASCESQLGAALAGMGRRAEAEPLLRSGLAALIEKEKADRLPFDGRIALAAARVNLDRFAAAGPEIPRNFVSAHD